MQLASSVLSQPYTERKINEKHNKTKEFLINSKDLPAF